MSSPDAPLNFPAWKAELNPPARFQSEVWQRIATRAPEHRSLLDRWLECLVFLLPRPTWAMALVTLSVGFGLGLGHLAGDKARSAAQQDAVAQYVAGINPLAHVSASE